MQASLGEIRDARGKIRSRIFPIESGNLEPYHSMYRYPCDAFIRLNMDGRTHQSDVSGSTNKESHQSSSPLWREAEVLLGGTMRGLGDTLYDRLVNHPLPTLAEVGTAAIGGYVLARMQGGPRFAKLGAAVI